MGAGPSGGGSDLDDLGPDAQAIVRAHADYKMYPCFFVKSSDEAGGMEVIGSLSDFREWRQKNPSSPPGSIFAFCLEGCDPCKYAKDQIREQRLDVVVLDRMRDGQTRWGGHPEDRAASEETAKESAWKLVG